VKYDLAKAHADYRGLIPPIVEALLAKYPRAALREVYVGDPRNDKDISLGYYDEDTKKIWMNSYWFQQSPLVLQKAAKSSPLFHGRMTAEPEHLVHHEFGHSVDWADHQKIAARRKEVWVAATKDPKSAVAAYGLTNDTEYYAELFAAVELGLASEPQVAAFRYVMGDD
jgi:hypothetical protein